MINSYELFNSLMVEAKYTRPKTFNVGDRVVYVNPNDRDLHNFKGTIMGEFDNYYAVEFDEKIYQGHTCSGLCKNKRGYWIRPPYLELLEVIEPHKIRWYNKGKWEYD